MLISYNSSKIQEICFLASSAAKQLGVEAARSLQARHADLQAAENINDVLVGQISIDENLCILTMQDLLTIEMIPNYGPIEEGDVYDWSTVERVKIVGINDVR